MVPLAAGPLPLFFERHMKNARPRPKKQKEAAKTIGGFFVFS